MRHRLPVLSTGLAVAFLAITAVSASAQQGVSKSKVDAKVLKKQCETLAQRENSKDNSSMAAPAPAVSDSIRQLCDSVNAANAKNKEKYQEPKPAVKDSTMPATPASTAMPATPATPADPNKPKDDATKPQ